MENMCFEASKAKSNHYYKLSIINKLQYPRKAAKLKNDFNLNDNELEMTYLLAFQNCQEIYVKDFQYRLLYIIYLNPLLYKIGLAETPLCSFCGDTEEILDHFLYQCEISSSFWKDLESFWNQHSNEELNRSQRLIFIGHLHKNFDLLYYFLSSWKNISL